MLLHVVQCCYMLLQVVQCCYLLLHVVACCVVQVVTCCYRLCCVVTCCVVLLFKLIIIVYYYLYSVSYGSNPVFGWAYNLVFDRASLIYLVICDFIY